MTSLNQDPAERLAYDIARYWRDPGFRPAVERLDWVRFANLACANRMAVLAGQVLEATHTSVPSPAAQILEEQIAKYRRLAALFHEPLTTYLGSASVSGVETLVLKGLWLCENVYGNPAMRPGADIDILVPRYQVAASIALLKAQGIDAFWPNLLSDEYFARHHLHQQRSSPDLKIWFEIHWALDHPYTLLTVDYPGIFQRAHAGRLLGAPLLEMAYPDLLLTLAIHLVKHAVYLPSLLERPDLPRIILSDGMLMHYLDVAEVLKRFQSDVDWDVTARIAHAWGATDALGSVLQVCSRLLDAPVPSAALSTLKVAPVSRITRNLMARAAEQKLAPYEGRSVSPVWQLLMASNGAFILRPIRLLETLSYFFPSNEFLVRRYGHAGFWARVRQFILAFYQSVRFGIDAVYFAFERYFRLKRMGLSASLFQRLDADL